MEVEQSILRRSRFLVGPYSVPPFPEMRAAGGREKGRAADRWEQF